MQTENDDLRIIALENAVKSAGREEVRQTVGRARAYYNFLSGDKENVEGDQV